GGRAVPFALGKAETQAERPGRQARLAQASLDVAAAEALMRSVLADVMELRSRADEPRRVHWTASIAHAAPLCRQAVAGACGPAGASSHNLPIPLQRTRRDMDTTACHMLFGVDARYRAHGRALLGLGSRSRWH